MNITVEHSAGFLRLETLALAFLCCGSVALALAAWKGDLWCIGVAIGFVFLSFVTWYSAR
jgi:hypothetical protein